MKNDDDIFKGLVGQALKTAPDATNEKNNSAIIRLSLAILGILAYLGVEAIKVTFRSNFGREGMNLFKVILSSLVFGVISYCAFNFEEFDLVGLGTPLSFKVTGFFYALWAVFVLLKGFYENSKAQATTHFPPHYQGDSNLLGFLVDDNWSQSRVQAIAEPLLTFGLGVFLSAVNLVWGLPIVFCAISVWIHQAVDSRRGADRVGDVIQQKGLHRHRGDYTEVR